MIEYGQSSGKIFLDGGELGVGYSGRGAGLNNHAMEATRGIGPIPVGEWKIEEWFDTYPGLGPCVARLLPVGHDAHGRDGFFIHGDNASMNHTASHGCIEAGAMIRKALRKSGETSLKVVA